MRSTTPEAKPDGVSLGDNWGMFELRHTCLALLGLLDPHEKALKVQNLGESWTLDVQAVWPEPAGLPGRPVRPELLPHTAIKPARLNTREGHAALLHSVCHIEKNAVDLALDVIWRFAGMPEDFYRDWWRVAQEEALHFTLLRDHLRSLAFDYGDFPAHTGLWDMAERTRHDVLARVALVPRTLEARGLDASPAVKTKLVSIGDHRAGEILDIILRDEIGHVAVGNRWYGWLCAQRGLDQVATYPELTQRYEAPRLKGPFNIAARVQAGFSQEELQQLQELTLLPTTPPVNPAASVAH
jgi:hypothetical protein